MINISPVTKLYVNVWHFIHKNKFNESFVKCSVVKETENEFVVTYDKFDLHLKSVYKKENLTAEQIDILRDQIKYPCSNNFVI